MFGQTDGRLAGHRAETGAQVLHPGQAHFREHHQPTHLLRRLGADLGLHVVREFLEGLAFQRVHQGPRQQQHLRVRWQVELHAQAQFMALDVVAMRRTPLAAPRSAFEQAFDHEAFFPANPLEAMVAAARPVRHLAEVKRLGGSGEQSFEGFEHRRSQWTRVHARQTSRIERTGWVQT
jgi:hypothetical protein